jgi:hypothetical protein
MYLVINVKNCERYTSLYSVHLFRVCVYLWLCYNHTKSYLQERVSSSHNHTAVQTWSHIHITHADTCSDNVTYAKHCVATNLKQGYSIILSVLKILVTQGCKNIFDYHNDFYFIGILLFSFLPYKTN